MYILKIHVRKLYRGVWYISKNFRSEAGYIEKALSRSGSLAIGFSREEKIVTADTIRKLLTKLVIPKCSHQYGELLSSYLRDKSMIVSTFRFILKLKSLWDAVLSLSTPDFYLMLMLSDYRKYLKLFTKRNCQNAYIFPTGLYWRLN